MSEETRLPNVLIVTLYSGENEYGQSCQALRVQTYPLIEHNVIAFRSNYDAHRQLYETIQELRDDYDIFIKLDADMILCNENTVAQIVSEFLNDCELDHAVFCVRDWASQTDIMGLHAYSNRVSWVGSEEKLFVDPNPAIPGHKKFYWSEPAPVAHHMPEPTGYQAYLFGFHRALKIVQRGRMRINVGQIYFQYALLENVWLQFQKHRDDTRRLMLVGAEDAFRGNRAVLEKKSCEDEMFTSSLTKKYPVPVLCKRWDREQFGHKCKKIYWVNRGQLLSKALNILDKMKAIITKFVAKTFIVVA